jgi:serine/threonine protein kinase
VKRVVGRYTLYDEVASGGMATVYLACLRGESGFARVVAVKMLHAQYAKEEAFRAMFLDEARLVSRIRHPNVVATLDVVEDEGELFLIMDYVHGESLSRLLQAVIDQGERVPPSIASAILVDTLEGLHAAHEATSEQGALLSVVHRDVSPHNILVGVDGVAHVADFGVAKAVGRLAEKFSVHHTVKGKAGYMAPEQIRGKVDRRADVYAAGVVLWETLVGGRLFTGDSFLEIVAKSMDASVPAPSSRRSDLDHGVDDVVLKALAHDPKARYQTAREMALALELAIPRAGVRDVGAWVQEVARGALMRRADQIARLENGPASGDVRTTIREMRAAIRLGLEETEPDGTPNASSNRSIVATINTVAGVAPPRESASRRARWAIGLALAVGVAVAGAGVFHQSASHGVPGAGAGSKTLSTAPPQAAAPSPIAPAAASEAIAQPESPSEKSVSSATGPTEPRPSASVASVQKHARRSPSAPLKTSITTAPATSSGDPPACHWEQLPDEQGILIPKKVCP